MWNAFEKAVCFVDIEGKKIHQYRLNDNQKKSWNTHKKPTFFFQPIDLFIYAVWKTVYIGLAYLMAV